MSAVSMIVALLNMVASIPVVGKVLVVVLSALVGVSALITALVGVWHGVVAAVSALASIPGLSGLSGVAKALQADAVVVDADTSQLLSWIQQLSAISIPVAPKA
jgi:hypothetical protein